MLNCRRMELEKSARRERHRHHQTLTPPARSHETGPEISVHSRAHHKKTKKTRFLHHNRESTIFIANFHFVGKLLSKPRKFLQFPSPKPLTIPISVLYFEQVSTHRKRVLTCFYAVSRQLERLSNPFAKPNSPFFEMT